MAETEDKSLSDGNATDEGLPDFIDTSAADDSGIVETDGGADEATSGQAEPPPAPDDVSGTDEVALAEAEAAAAAAAAEAAAAKARFQAVKVKAQKAPARKKAKPPTPPPPPKKRAPKPVPHRPRVDVEPNPEGLFDNKAVDEAAGVGYVPPAPYLRGRRSIIALIISVLSVVFVLVAIFVISGDQALSHDMECFFDGKLKECKRLEADRLMEQWAAEDRASRNRYGDMDLSYFPADAKVTITQVKFVQEGLTGATKKDEEKALDNPSLHLDKAKQQLIESLPLRNLAIFQAQKAADGSVEQIFTYEYRLKFEREGYETFLINYKPEHWKQMPAGENERPKVKVSKTNRQQVDWRDTLELTPTLATTKANFLKAMGDLLCLMKTKQLPIPEDTIDLYEDGIKKLKEARKPKKKPDPEKEKSST